MTDAAAPRALEQRAPARRLFFAVWPDEPARLSLAEAMKRHVDAGLGRAQRADQWHLTVEFLGDVPEARLPDVLDAGAAASAPARAFDVAFDRIEYWKRPQVLCLSASSIPGPLASLVRSLRSELARRGFVPEARPYKAHVTLARKMRQASPVELVDPLRWPAGELALVQSVTDRSGSRYESLATWPLGG